MIFAIIIFVGFVSAVDLNGCTTITESGEYYLQRNIIDSSGDICFNIQADDVTLDLNGYVVDGDEESISGVYSNSNVNNIVIKNGLISGWSSGVWFSGGENITLENLQVLFNRYKGIELENILGSTIQNNFIKDNPNVGIELDSCEDSLIYNNEIKNINRGEGSIELYNSKRIEIRENNLNNNDGGISIEQGSNIKILNNVFQISFQSMQHSYRQRWSLK